MSTQTLGSVTVCAIGQYGELNKLIIGAYGQGAKRLLTQANARYAAFLESRELPLVTEKVKASLLAAQHEVAALVEQGIAGVDQRAGKAIDLIADGVTEGIKRLEATGERIDTAFDTRTIATANTVALPVAQVVLELANQAVEGSKRLAGQLVGDSVEEVAEAAAPVKRVARKTGSRANA